MTQRINRVYQACELNVDTQMNLDEDAVRHLVTVLKSRVGDAIILFNGDGYDYRATITHVAKREAAVQVHEKALPANESPLDIHLFQAVARGDKMDWVIQKAVEMGVQSITPLFTVRTGVKLPEDRLRKKMAHWQKIIISACEQSGRSRLPTLRQAISLNELVQSDICWPHSIILDPHHGQSIMRLPQYTQYNIFVGPEGGFSDEESSMLRQQQCLSVQLGPRILRTETAGLAICSVLQARFGDF
ncbi:16S rRNA (uracil(1498)-N(3))-methyltransferase [Pleionea litopenaei]|uniref:Ribosomal RNA small subunit methyltransferase E n=1 Tax=Pleionea litopenaei TaxID=3070815 RepID=A0AA51RRG5_9GAMM|nr:16S rRNA (uracil(1498)-N(3))-methyltransferase [Pleionea sp. HL-JVS1]WMS86236.1 16S rRNA (uracil(1498)-N(3))-methyltransferase [Pleionea sp. HL-JVS1]